MTDAERARSGDKALCEADLRGADLREENLYGANLRGADLPSPTMMLMVNWGSLPDTLTADLMVYDAACHPDPSAFSAWANGGPCPYENVRVERAAGFAEQKHFWDATRPLRRPYDLMADVLDHCCPGWREPV